MPNPPQTIRVVRQGPAGVPSPAQYLEEVLTPVSKAVTINQSSYTNGRIESDADGSVTVTIPTSVGGVNYRYRLVVNWSNLVSDGSVTFHPGSIGVTIISAFGNPGEDHVIPVVAGTLFSVFDIQGSHGGTLVTVAPVGAEAGQTGAGDVVGPNGNSANSIPAFSGTTGKVIAESGAFIRGVQTISLGGQDNYADVNVDFSRYSVVVIHPTASTLGGDNIVKLNITPDPISGVGILKWVYDYYGNTNLIFGAAAFNNAFQTLLRMLDVVNSGQAPPWTTNNAAFRITLGGTDEYYAEIIDIA